MLTKKNRYIHSDRIVVEGNCSVVIKHILPPKHKDPGVVPILCTIGEVDVGKALIDLGASINLMPLSMCRRLGEIEIMPTCMMSYPNFVRGPLLDNMRPFFGPCEVLGIHH